MVSKPVFAAIIIIALLIAGVAGYYVGQMTVAPTGPVLPDKIKIGALMALTGPLGPMGVEIVKGVELAVDEANAQGGVAGRQIELIVEDTATDPVTALEACRKLVEVDGVKVIVGPMASGEVAGMADYVNTNHIVIITPSATMPVVPVGDDYIFRTVGSDIFQGRALADIITDAGYDKVAILVCDNPYGLGI
ncbi:MAG: ABC transporter substrate-binding protein, partial [archaeon]|nr:ABC transporter substrate-binding protein [archaeon]